MTINEYAGALTRKRLLYVIMILAVLHLADTSGVRLGSVAGVASAQQSPVVLVNAASYANDAGAGMAPNSIGALYGQFVTQGNQPYPVPPTATTLPTSLGGVGVTIGGKPAQLFFAGPTQINLLVPSDLADGNAPIVVTNSDGTTRNGTIRIVREEPGIFTALSTGTGTAAALTTFDGVSYSYVANADGTPRDVDPGTRQRTNYLVLFGTGFRLAAQPSVSVTIQGVPSKVEYAGSSSSAGLDQINVAIPPELAGFGSVVVQVRTGSRNANRVTMRIGGELPPITVNQIAEGQVVSGELSVQDQVQPGNNTSDTYFFDAYLFQTTTPNTTVAIDMRGTAPLNSMILLYRNDNGRLTQVAQDDDAGGDGAPESSPARKNALLLSVLQTPGQYVIFATTSNSQANGTGQYTIKYNTNLIQPIAYGQSISGQVSTTDLKNSADTYLDAYWFSGLLGERPAISLNSTAFDSYLLLSNNGGDLLAENDNAPGVQTLNSLINGYTLAATGIHIIVATPLEPNRTGAYTLGLSRQTPLINGIGAGALSLEALFPSIGTGSDRQGTRRPSDGPSPLRSLAARGLVVVE